MENIVRFEPTAVDDPRARSNRQSSLDAYLLALAENELLVGVEKTQIKKDIAILDSIARSTENPLLRQNILIQLSEIKSKLLLVSLKLFSAKETFQNLAKEPGIGFGNRISSEQISGVASLM